MRETRTVRSNARGRRARGGFLAGMFYPFLAMGVLSHTPRLWRYVLIPILVNIAIGATLYLGLLLAGLRGIDAFVGDLPGWAAVIGVLLRVLLVIALLLITGFVLVRFGVVLGSPWYAKLSEELERSRIAQVPAAERLSAGGIARDLMRALGFELQKLLLVIAVGLLLLLLNLLPVAGTVVSSVGWIALGALIACLDFLEGPLERRRMGFRAKVRLIRRGMPASAGFGLVCLGLISIPFVNLLAIPLCVTAGTLFFCDQIWPDL